MTDDDKALVERLRANDAEIYLPILGEAAFSIEILSAENERLREALFELQNQDIGRLHDLLNQALLLMRDDDMELPGSDHWVWALDAIAALGGKK